MTLGFQSNSVGKTYVWLALALALFALPALAATSAKAIHPDTDQNTDQWELARKELEDGRD